MQLRKQGTGYRGLLMAAALLAAALGASGAPAMAASQEFEGFFVALDLAMTQPTGLDQQYATYVDTVNLFSSRQVIDNDADLSYAIKLGYSWGATGGLAVSYWSFDNEDKVEESVGGAYVYPNVFGVYAYNLGGSYGLGFGVGGLPVTVNATSKVEASTIDIDYFRPMQAGEKVTIKWIAGLRSAAFEETRTFDGIDSLGSYYIENKHIDSDAFGVKLGAGVNFGFSEHFSLQGMMAFSVLQASTDAEATRNASGLFFDKVTSSDDNVNGEIRDYDLRAVWTYNNLDFWLGYGGQTWEGLVTDPINGSCCGASGADTSQRDSIGFNKLHVGVAFRFGGD
jgi:Legionella pneumophila major outer membrane protein precursor